MVSADFFRPLLIDVNLRLIDGSTRLATALSHGMPQVHAYVVDATDSQAGLLNLLINKSEEFQRWRWEEVHAWLEGAGAAHISTLEPLGIFGERLIPQSFLGDTVIDYVDYNSLGVDTEQRKYKQEPGLSKWAAIARRERAEEKQLKQDMRDFGIPRKRKSKPKLIPLARPYVVHATYPLASLTAWDALKRKGWERKKALKRVIGITGFVAPLVADSHGRVLDGHLRLEVVRELHEEGWWPEATVPVVMVEADEDMATYLRIVLNRTQEFQRWNYDTINQFIDQHPQLRPLYEPFGLYTEAVLPETFWHNTALTFPRPHPLKGQVYDPETMTLPQWAELTGAVHRHEQAEKAATPLKQPGDHAPVFSKPWSSADLLPIHDVQAAIRENTLKMREVAETITRNYDEKRRTEKVAKGEDWQTSRRKR